MNLYVESLRRVWESPSWKQHYVSIIDEGLEEVAGDLARQELLLPAWDMEFFPQANDDTFIDFLIVSGAVNFCFTDFATNEKFDADWGGTFFQGSSAMFASLMRAMEEGLEVLNPEYLAQISETDIRHIFRHVNTPIPMLESRRAMWRNLAEGTMMHFGDKFSNIFQHSRDMRVVSEKDSPGIADILVAMLSDVYWDYSLFDAEEKGWKDYLDFNKRAQLVPMMYHGRAMNSNGALAPISDPENFGPICDYQVPHGLHHLGVLRYCGELTRKIDCGELIAKDSREEIELRLVGCAQVMCELLSRVNSLRAPDRQITMAELDNAIWRLGREAPGRHHYTYTTAY